MNQEARSNTYHLSDAHYAQFQELVLKRTGMLFGPRRRNAMARGVISLAKAVTGGNLNHYFQMLQESETDSLLWDDLIEELTIGETYFFRDENQIRALREHILPQIISAHRHDRRVRIWSAGCASGEEPYTMAMLLAELIVGMDQWNLFILGTDINKKVLQKAREARYRPWSFRQTQPLYQSRYFRNKGEEYELVPWVRKHVHLAYLNLNETIYPSLTTNTNAMDLILCRNVAIYYSESVVRHIAERFHRCLLPGGWLVMGAAETSIPVFNQYETCVFSGGTVFQRPSETPRAPIRFDIRPTDFEIKGVEAPSIRPLSPEKPPKKEVTAHIQDEMPLKRAEKSGPKETQSEGPDPFQDALRLIRKKQYEKAIDTLRLCIATNPKDADSLYHLARVHANIGEMEAAKSLCEQALEIDPLNTQAHLTLALVYQEMGDPASAMTQLKRALFLDGKFALAHFNLAMLYGQMEQTEKAARHRRQAIRLAAQMEPDAVLAGSDDLTARSMLTMARALE